ncbi:MAG TPA: hypothetical protein ENN07_07925 [candidate division Zixibacteria bacterium]|nr:hypothetical protein [candidate division Zixibacteria bacterium]
MISQEQIRTLVFKAGYAGDYEIHMMPGGGSDRIFYRVQFGNFSLIIMNGTGHGADLRAWTIIGKFLRDIGIAVPQIYYVDYEIPAIVVEDLGKMSPPKIEDYPIIACQLAKLQSDASAHLNLCPLILERPFSYDEFIGEAMYFYNEYLIGIKNVSHRISQHFFSQVGCFAHVLSELPRFFCHRDFQSSNLIIQNGNMRIIDFQSAKYGPLHYDLASLLWDSRVDLDDDVRNNLCHKYIETATSFCLPIEANFVNNLHIAGISRIMQSLGAYSYLANKKGKPEFNNLIPVAESHLLSLIGEFPKLEFLTEYILMER